MKINRYSGSAFVHSALVVIFYLSNASAQSNILNGKSVYVWDFATRDGETNTLTTSFTEEFEEALIQSRQCRVLERRNYARLFAQKENERGILNLEQISKSKIESLKSFQAEVVIFGETFDDTDGGHLKISVNVQNFQANILAKESILLSRGKRYDPESRRAAIEELVGKIISNKSVTSPSINSLLVGKAKDNFLVEATIFNPLDRDLLATHVLLRKYQWEDVACRLSGASHLILSDKIVITSVNGDSIEFRTSLIRDSKEFSNYTFVAKGSYDTGCGHESFIINFESSFILTKNSYTTLFITVPKQFKIVEDRSWGTAYPHPQKVFTVQLDSKSYYDEDTLILIINTDGFGDLKYTLDIRHKE